MEEHHELREKLDAASGKDDTYSKGIQHYKVQHRQHELLPTLVSHQEIGSAKAVLLNSMLMTSAQGQIRLNLVKMVLPGGCVCVCVCMCVCVCVFHMI